jgi:hypothetical protein
MEVCLSLVTVATLAATKVSAWRDCGSAAVSAEPR